VTSASLDTDHLVTGLTPKGQATRGRIVATAAELIYARGVSGTHTSDVQEAAGVGAAQLYHYFHSKRDLVAAVIDHQVEATLDAQRPWFARLDSIDDLRAWRDAMVEAQRRRQCHGGCPIGSIGSELAKCDPAARANVAAGLRLWELAIRDGLLAMRGRGELRVDANPERLALATLAALQGGLLMSQIRRDTAGLEASLDTIIDYIGSFIA
jgi:AcrR family transcriptional regulator